MTVSLLTLGVKLQFQLSLLLLSQGEVVLTQLGLVCGDFGTLVHLWWRILDAVLVGLILLKIGEGGGRVERRWLVIRNCRWRRKWRRVRLKNRMLGVGRARVRGGDRSCWEVACGKRSGR